MRGIGPVVAPEQQATNQLSTLRRFLQYLRPYRKEIPIALTLVMIGASTQAIGPFLLGWSVDHLIAQGNLQGLLLLLALLGVIYSLGVWAIRGQIMRVGWIMQRLLAQLRQDIFIKIQSLPLSFFDRSEAGDLMSRLLNDVNTVNQAFGQTIAQMLGNIFSLVGIVIAMLTINLQLGLLSNLVVPLMILTTSLFARWARARFRVTRQTIGELSAKLEEDIGSVREAQAFNRVHINIAEFDILNAANRDANVEAVAITAAFLPSIDFLNTLATAGVLAYGGYLAVTGGATVGVVTSFLLYVQQFFRPIQILSQFYTQAQSAFAGLERIFLLLDEPSQLNDVPDAIEMPPIQGEVTFEDVKFGYNPEQLVLKGVNLHAYPGQMIALVGPTGSGKTTIINLILRFYDVSDGAVKIDEIDVRSVTQASLRRQIGIVLQDNILFSGTVAENIAFGVPNATQADIEAAAQLANVHEFITSLPQGYTTQLGERGAPLSQGQRQLISIARAVLINPRILILDEATSSIDTRTEALVQSAIARLLQGRTSFVIAHRLSTVTQASQVLVIQQGQIVERGTHAELIAKQGVYANLYALQLGATAT
ncbi:MULTISPECIES: ABC transporter ATP-binding protein [unclassified Tolypothrix]|uniref:ABC transporter ATP-binding protein n=1 Tax=unclassified Tolypothrix TaxID=2649714 RepID=UPI0005EAA350|nr:MULTISPECIES: ABC transporter ATP-binding protein [unclassified Tolypothrix]BAY88115.1 ABC transporter, transmembrane region [Microchaete diplosiphon NIES-3275]EKE97472.1 ABC transporter, ATP-binding protein [Tolypothrix sp. PCC 7601]MBE9086407.1 ABC transporter ATP-binding protein [Tolypothrix sp. LEGE 11397]UYD28824.1 ABC transporter ATP-binding protein [Tolypothrix sp. PCC 7712]UYD35264.1 ABC transporter ATP-binding protein [Tolypothrix sp. PCC 7601]